MTKNLISTPQFAEEIIRIGTKAQIEYNPLPVDDPKVRQPDRHAREESARLGTEGEVRGRDREDDRVFQGMSGAWRAGGTNSMNS